MEKNMLVQKPRTSTVDMLTWTEAPVPASSNAAASASAQRSYGRSKSNQPSDAISKVVFGIGGQVADDEAQSLLNKKPCSGYKLKEITGSGIFGGNDVSGPTATERTRLRMYQQAVNGISQISFRDDGIVPPKKPTSVPEVAKQRELSGTLQAELNSKHKKQMSASKYKEISGHDIFAPAPEIRPRSLAAANSMESKDSMRGPGPRNVQTSVKISNPVGGQTSTPLSGEPVMKTAKKIHAQKFQQLTGNDIFKEGGAPVSAEKPLSRAKLQEMSGNNIFSDGKVESRDYRGGVRKPPGGASSIALV